MISTCVRPYRAWIACALAFALAACSDTDPCNRLVRALCSDPAVRCDRAAAWLDHELLGRDRKALSDMRRDQVCRWIEADHETRANFVDKARADLISPTRR